MNKKTVISKTKLFVQKSLQNDSSGHDWWHIYRVWKNAKVIARNEKSNLFIVELGALLHDIADWKFHNGDFTVGTRMARNWLNLLKLDKKDIDSICEIIKNVSFKGAGIKSKMKTIEGRIVQDADRLDAIGAIGIARCFAYGGYSKTAIYDPENKPKFHRTFEEYKSSKSSSISHFYEKLLLLKDLMNTKTAKKIAQSRHKFMLKFLNQFYSEWEAKQ